MPHTLLLQASTHSTTVEVTSLTNVYLALGGTLIAAIIAALASWNAAKTAEKAANLAATTAKNVADLSRQTTKEVADLSAQVTRESAGLAAQTAREIKETDYKHDFYKKIIAKRFTAWENAEKLITKMVQTVTDTEDNKIFYKHCISGSEFDIALSEMQAIIIGQIIWMGREYTDKFLELYNLHIDIRRKSVFDADDNTDTMTIIDNKLLVKNGKKYFPIINPISSSLLQIIAKQLGSLHNVEEFIKEAESMRIFKASNRLNINN